MRSTLVARLAPGDKVRLTGEFLRNTGQIAGGQGQDRWIVQACPCRSCEQGDWVCTNEPTSQEYTAEEIRAEPWIVHRHIHRGNLERVGREVSDRFRLDMYRTARTR